MKRIREEINGRELTLKILKKLRAYDKLNFLESYAVFMGKSQLIEIALKQVLIDKYGYKEVRVEKFTLGKSIYELKKKKLNGYYIGILENLNKCRIDMAHYFLAVDVIITTLLKREHRLSRKPLEEALFTVEQATYIHDLLFNKKSRYNERNGKNTDIFHKRV